jgi:hypothetical protein
MFTLFQLSCVTSDIIFNFFKVISMWYCSEKTPFRKTNQREYVSIYIINSMPARDIRLARYDPSDNVCLDPQNCIYSKFIETILTVSKFCIKSWNVGCVLNWEKMSFWYNSVYTRLGLWCIEFAKQLFTISSTIRITSSKTARSCICKVIQTNHRLVD